MENLIFSNKQVSEIVKLTPRQVLSWSEKGLILAFEEATSSGTKRGYDYINLLEFSLCKKLFGLGIGFRAVKKIINNLRRNKDINDWASNFKTYHELIFQNNIDTLDTMIKDQRLKGDLKQAEFTEGMKSKLLQIPYLPDKPKGVLVYVYGDKNDHIFIIPWEMEYVINLSMIQEAFKESGAGFFIDIGKIKEEIDIKF